MQTNERVRGDAGGYIPVLLIFTGTYAVSALSAQASFLGLAEWYPSLRQPSFTPPNFIFGPVWTVLYGMMAAAASLVWRTGLPARRGALALYWLQVVLNGVWSGLFFGLRQTGAAALELGLLIVTIGLTIVAFRPLRPLAAWLLVPYLVWSLFALALNVAIWNLNRGRASL